MHIGGQHITHRGFYGVVADRRVFDDDIGRIIDDKGFVAGTADQGCDSRAGSQRIVGTDTRQRVVAGAADYPIIEIGAGDRYVTRARSDIEASGQQLAVSQCCAIGKGEILDSAGAQRIGRIESSDVHHITGRAHAHHQLIGAWRPHVQGDHAGGNAGSEGERIAAAAID